jgi:protein-tyrosine-phosphatase
MTTGTFTIGVVCTGNTCRSPVTAAWIRHFLIAERLSAKATLWTAGLCPGQSSVVGEEALEIAKEMGLSDEPLNTLTTHRATPLTCESRPTSLLVWISDPERINDTYDDKTSRAGYMMATALKLGAALMVIPEADEAWSVKQSSTASDAEKLQAYRAQAQSLYAWAKTIARFVPRTVA